MKFSGFSSFDDKFSDKDDEIIDIFWVLYKSFFYKKKPTEETNRQT
jgi:hypothetical protein